MAMQRHLQELHPVANFYFIYLFKSIVLLHLACLKTDIGTITAGGIWLYGCS